MTHRRASFRHAHTLMAAACLFFPQTHQAAGSERIDSADANAPQPNVVETDGAQSSGPGMKRETERWKNRLLECE